MTNVTVWPARQHCVVMYGALVCKPERKETSMEENGRARRRGRRTGEKEEASNGRRYTSARSAYEMQEENRREGCLAGRGGCA